MHFTIAVERRIICASDSRTRRCTTNIPKELIGKAEELSALAGFIEALAEGPRAFVVEGEAGIGKTTVWQAGVRAAELAGCRVLSCRPTGSEARFSFAALGDLLQGVPVETLSASSRAAAARARVRRSSSPRQATIRPGSARLRSAFSACSARLPTPGRWWWRWTTRSGSTGRRRACSSSRRVVCATEPVGLLLARRSTGDEPAPLGLAQAFPEERLRRIRLGPLSLRELHRLLFGRLGVDLRLPALRRLREASGGNPFFALEIGRALVRSGSDADPGGALPVPETLRELVRDRLAALPARTRDALLAASALSQPTLGLVEAAVGDGADASSALARALEADVIELDQERIRFTHPLLASTLYAEASPERRRQLHRRLASASADPEEKARHLALAADGPDATVASALDHAALAARVAWRNRRRSAAHRAGPAADPARAGGRSVATHDEGGRVHLRSRGLQTRHATRGGSCRARPWQPRPRERPQHPRQGDALRRFPAGDPPLGGGPCRG